MEGRRIDVVRRLPEVHMVVGIDVLILAFLVTQTLQGEIGDHLVGIHIGRGARAALNEVGDELIEHLARDQPITRSDDRVGDLSVEHTEIPVRHRGGFLDVAERLDEIGFPRNRHARDVKVFLAPDCLDAVIGVRRNFAVAEKIVFHSEFGC